MRLLIRPLITLSLLTASYSVHAASDATSTASNNFQLKPVPELQDPPTDRFPGDPAEHKAVYMFNKSDAGYQTGILN